MTFNIQTLPPGMYHDDEGKLICVPSHLGPTWRRNPDWDGASKLDEFVLPEHTLGWHALNWISKNLLDDETDEYGEQLPWKPTNEQKRFILHFYALDENGEFLYREVVLQRLKGWGKDPLAAAIAMVEFVGPCRFMGWAKKDMPHLGLSAGDAVGKPHPRAWIQVAAVSEEQTKNTMKLLSGFVSASCMKEHSITSGILTWYAYHGQRTLTAVTGSPRALEGGRPTLVIKNEALALDTAIPTPSGWTTMGALKAGDTIFGADGQPTVVTKAHPVQLGRRTFEVVFNTGDTIKASDGHYWKVRVANNENCTLREMTTLEMFEAKREFFPPRLPVTGVQYEEKELPVDPYLLGLWLGDGHSWDGQIACAPEDIQETLSEIRKTTPLAKVIGSRALHISLSSRDGKGRGIDSVKQRLRILGVLQNKHIPEIYMSASLEQRLALLQGLYDSDGHIRPGGEARFSNVNTELLGQVRDLLISVGYDARPATFQHHAHKPGRENWSPIGSISVVAHDGAPLFRLARKAEKMRSGMPKSRVRKIVEIREVESVPVRCISVSAPDKLFMASRGYLATRNTHQWVTSNNGHEMADAIERNATKAKDGAARTLSITNAYQPSEYSVAQVEREAWEAEAAEDLISSGVMYDSLEAPPDAKLRPPTIELPNGEKLEPTAEEIIDNFRAILEAVRGDSVWLNVKNMTKSILSRKNKSSRSRRFWFNSVVAAEDAWVAPEAIRKAISPAVARLREEPGHDPLRVGWDLILPGEEIVIFGDCSKSDDSTGIVGCRLSDGYIFTIGIWEKPPGKRGESWLAPREAFRHRIDEAFKRFKVIACWIDPSHTKDDEDGSHYWDTTIDKIMQDHREELDPKHWPLKSGHKMHAVLWDMASPANNLLFIDGAETFLEEIQRLNDIEEFDPTFYHDANPLLMQHLRQAVEAPTDKGMSLMKENRESAKKVDLAVCAVGAKMLSRIVLNKGVEAEEPAGTIWGR